VRISLMWPAGDGNSYRVCPYERVDLLVRYCHTNDVMA
jgi:hypothetical protein